MLTSIQRSKLWKSIKFPEVSRPLFTLIRIKELKKMATITVLAMEIRIIQVGLHGNTVITWSSLASETQSGKRIQNNEVGTYLTKTSFLQREHLYLHWLISSKLKQSC